MAPPQWSFSLISSLTGLQSGHVCCEIHTLGNLQDFSRQSWNLETGKPIQSTALCVSVPSLKNTCSFQLLHYMLQILNVLPFFFFSWASYSAKNSHVSLNDEDKFLERHCLPFCHWGSQSVLHKPGWSSTTCQAGWRPVDLRGLRSQLTDRRSWGR